MTVRRVILDVDKALNRPTLLELASAIEKVQGVEAVNVSVTEMDMETMGTIITVEGNGIDFSELINSIEETGSVIHSVDEIVVGKRIIESIRRDE
ncbi:MAG: hypothetical protein AMDU1_APLC00007G0035 [Thermoplasmatales archaeon A-plasma]|jgi:hypothetical protein|nr:MAG: hypothetical protein AMDU1_APLC00007G0035 [Thermoplasmatales archaeon A-plasma]MCL4331000.1 DUF211 domain-containing protein [Candidatus Thermoplasmatota archaeon]WMT44369.1 MAG: DUF211 domain-containing protein [Cuniculiplasma divulgatum]